MSDQIRQAREASVEVYWALRDTREGGYNCLYQVSMRCSMSLCSRNILKI